MSSPTQTAPDDACSDQHASCRRWAAAGNCVRLQSFMHEECAAACDRCEVDAPETEPCTPVSDAVGPGAIARTFGRAAALEHLKPRVLSEDPFVLVFDDFATAADAAEVASLAEDVGFEPSGSSCGYRAGGCNSASMSCLPVQGGDCWSHAPMRRLESRMLEVLQLPSDNCEPLRFVRYGRGEYFARHHDAAGQALAPHTPGGPRVWTLYVFLAAAASFALMQSRRAAAVPCLRGVQCRACGVRTPASPAYRAYLRRAPEAQGSLAPGGHL